MKLTIIGASGHGRVAADIAEKVGYDEIEFLDDNSSLTVCGKWRVVGTAALAEGIDNDLFIAIGNESVRESLTKRFCSKRIVSLVHPSAVIGAGVEVGEGSMIVAGAVVNPYAKIGKSCIVNTCSSVDHDCVVGDFVHVAVGARLCGTVTVGERCWIGAGATVINNLSVCADCVVGAGATVIKDITVPGTYVGVPARMIKAKE